jgi:hypothetical protein
VAKKPNSPQQHALTRGKAVLIGVLAVVLVGVLYMQYGKHAGGSETGEVVPAVARAPARTLPTPLTTTPETAAETDAFAQAALLEFDQTKWKPPEISKVIAYDPFALPAGFPQSSSFGLNVAAGGGGTSDEKSKQLADALAELRMQLDELKERGVHVIVGQKGQYVAMIGDRMVHVGDEIGSGFTVTEIDPKEGVSVGWKSSE